MSTSIFKFLGLITYIPNYVDLHLNSHSLLEKFSHETMTSLMVECLPLFMFRFQLLPCRKTDIFRQGREEENRIMAGGK